LKKALNLETEKETCMSVEIGGKLIVAHK